MTFTLPNAALENIRCPPNGPSTRLPGSPGPTITRHWPEKFVPIPWIYAEIVRLLALAERVRIFVQPSTGGQFAREVLDILEHATTSTFPV